jgi:uncharacterized protein (UPF0264 family)
LKTSWGTSPGRSGVELIDGSASWNAEEQLLSTAISRTDAGPRYSPLPVSRQAIGNALAGVLFLIVGIWDFTRDDSGIGVVFVIFAAVFLGLGFSGKKRIA